jgi:hypothetical protein
VTLAVARVPAARWRAGAGWASAPRRMLCPVIAG